MNCEQIAAILDDGDAAGLSEAKRAEADAHLQSCAPCRADWLVHARLAAKAVPPIADDLPTRIWRSLPADAAADSGRRTLIVPLLLFAGAAAAMLALVSMLESDLDADPVAAVELEITSTPDAETATATATATATDGADESGTGSGTAEVPEVLTGQPRRRLVIWPIRYEDEATASIQTAEAAHRAVVRFFRAQANLEVIEATPAQWDSARAAVGDIDNPGRSVTGGVTMLGSGVRRAMALELGSEYSVQVASGSSSSPLGGSIGLAQAGPTGGGSSSMSVRGDGDAVGTDLAQQVYAQMFPDASAPLIESVLLDLTRSDADRLNALDTLLRSMPRVSPDGVFRRGDVSPPAFAAAIELGRSSTSAATRRRVWEQLSQTGSPLLAQPLTDTLLYDADDEVRAVAADALTAFRAEPAVRAALESVAVGDASSELRLRARWSAFEDTERTSYVSAMLLDPGLTPEQRMAPVILARTRRPGIPGSMARDAEIPALEGNALEGIARIASGNVDDSIRRAALFELGYARHPDFVTLLFDGSDTALRRSVLIDLSNRRGTPGVLEQIEQALEAEPDAGVRQMMESLLSPAGFPIRPPAGQ